MRSYLLLALVLAPALLDAAGIKMPRKGSDALDEQPIIDGHNDLPYNLRTIEKNQLANFNFSANLDQSATWNCPSCFTDLPRLRKGKVGAQFWVAYVPCAAQYKDAVEQTLEQIDVIKRLVKAYPNDMVLAKSEQEVRFAQVFGKIASLIAIEGGHSIDSRLSVLRQMYELGARYMTLTHSCNTPWADGSPADGEGGVADHNGLSVWGKNVIMELNRLGMMVDLSHVSAQTMKDALNITRAPVIFSHSSAWELCNHHRNIKDDVLGMMAANGGIVMVNFYSGYVQCDSNKKATIDDVVDHINHIRTVAGWDHVGIGSDFDDVDQMPEGLEDVSKYPALFDKLLESDPEWTEERLTALAGGNLLRVFAQVERVRDVLSEEVAVETLIPVEDLGKNVQCRTDIGATIQGGGSRMAPSMWVAGALTAAIYKLLQ